MHLKAAVMEKGTRAVGTLLRSFPSVKAFMKLEVDKLSKAGWADLALVRPLT